MGKKLTLYLTDGTDTGPRTIEIGNWSGKGIYSPRTHLIKMMERSEYQKPGVYILKLDPEKDIYNDRIYIGEAENLKTRLKQHMKNSDRDFNECIVFISKDELLTKSHIKYIESRLIYLAKEAQNSEIENSVQPSINTLSEADISDMEYFINEIKIILPTVGFNCLISNKSIEEEVESEKQEVKIFYIRGKKVKARMRASDEGITVLKESQANLTISDSIGKGWIKLRERLIAENILMKEGEYYIFKKDYTFKSSSAAAATVLGRQVAGPVEWIDENRKSYKDYESEKLDKLNDNDE